MDFSIPEDLRLLQATARRFVQEELYPLERQYLLVDQVPADVRHAVERKAQAVGLWALAAPPELGGGGIPAVGLCLVQEERYKALLGRSELDPFGGDPSPALLTCAGDDYQRERFLLPVIRGEKHECLCQTEPNAGSDPSSLETTAVREGDSYLLDGTKIFIGRYYSDIFLTLATVDRRRGRRGITAFLIERDTPGFNIVRLIPMMDGATPAHIVLDHCVVPAHNRLGEEGEGFSAGQADLGRARIMWGPKCVGRSERCLEMGIRYAKQRVTFGRPIADRQAIQWMLADSAVEIHASRLMSYHAAWKVDQGLDVRQEASMVKLYSSEMQQRVVDRVVQIHGAYGLSKDLPLEKTYRVVRHDRIGEGTSEIHRFVIARNLLRD